MIVVYTDPPTSGGGPLRKMGNALELHPGRTHLWYCVCRNWNSSLMRSRVSGYVSFSDWGGPDAAAAAAAAAATTEAEEPGGGCRGA